MDTINIILTLLLTALISYLLGSLNSAIIVCRLLKNKDIRQYGSKNAGLTNTLRVFGKGPALLTLLSDLLKGVVAVFICRYIAYKIGSFDDTLVFGYLAGVFAILGHSFPIYYGFKGGKGVLVAATTLLAIDPVTFAIVIPLFALLVLITNYVSLSSIIAAFSYPVVTLITQLLRNYEHAYINAALTLVIGLFIVYKHKDNIKRLKAGTENKFRKNK